MGSPNTVSRQLASPSWFLGSTSASASWIPCLQENKLCLHSTEIMPSQHGLFQNITIMPQTYLVPHSPQTSEVFVWLHRNGGIEMGVCALPSSAHEMIPLLTHCVSRCIGGGHSYAQEKPWLKIGDGNFSLQDPLSWWSPGPPLAPLAHRTVIVTASPTKILHLPRFSTCPSVIHLGKPDPQLYLDNPLPIPPSAKPTTP